MGLNTRLDKSRDKIPALNLTQNKAFKCEITEGKEKQRFELVLGLNVGQSRYIIKINGACSIALNDKIKLFNDTMKVTSTKQFYDDINQFQHRQDISNMSGYTVVVLE